MNSKTWSIIGIIYFIIFLIMGIIIIDYGYDRYNTYNYFIYINFFWPVLFLSLIISLVSCSRVLFKKSEKWMIISAKSILMSLFIILATANIYLLSMPFNFIWVGVIITVFFASGLYLVAMMKPETNTINRTYIIFLCILFVLIILVGIFLLMILFAPKYPS